MCNALGSSTELMVVHEAGKKLKPVQMKVSFRLKQALRRFSFFKDNSYETNSAQDLGCLSECPSVT